MHNRSLRLRRTQNCETASLLTYAYVHMYKRHCTTTVALGIYTVLRNSKHLISCFSSHWNISTFLFNLLAPTDKLHSGSSKSWIIKIVFIDASDM